MDSDKEILNQYHKNNELGFRFIVEKFQQRIYWQIRRQTKNHQDTEDILQTVFIKIWKALPQFRGESALYSWIYRIAANETITFLSKESKRKSVEKDPPLFENEIAVNGENYNPEKIEALFFQALNTLPEKQRIVFELKYFDELKFSEIEQLLGTSVGALKASYHHAAKKIETYLLSV